VTALRSVRAGNIYLSDVIATEMLERVASHPPAPSDVGTAELNGLSDRELEVLRLIARGLKTGEIASTLRRSTHTIETHRASIKRKLGLRTSGELSKAAFALNAEDPPKP
jgi:two-component system, NarL family, response regulator NreC